MMFKTLLTCWVLCLAAVPALAEKKNNSVVAKSLEEYVRQARASQPPLQTAEGSLYSDAGLTSSLFTDLKARRVNDILTVRVLENTTASSGADTNATRKSSKSLAIPNLFGLENHTGGVPLANLVSANSNSAFAGEGATNRQGSLSALLSARVREVLPNGDLVIEGIKELKVNNERQTLTLIGVVRTRDIAPSNVVSSTAIANMQIQLDGKGVVSDHLNPGWLYRVLTKVWPF